MTNPILIVDDDKKIANLLSFHLEKQGYRTHSVYRGEDTVPAIKQYHPLLVLLDIRLPDCSGSDVLQEIRKNHPQVYVIMISAHADVKMAVDCMRLGAYDFVEKPLNFPEFDAKVKRVFNQFQLEEEVSSLKRELGEKYKFKTMIGKSNGMKQTFASIDIAAKSDVSVLIEGESGTGKELAARAIHFNSVQKQGPFIAVNCAAIPENLLESELFGHEKGSFTGAIARRIGRFEQAQGGTLFLDEIGDLPASLQVKLLRVLQEREIDRVGGTSPVAIDVRFIVATHRDLKALVREGKFREDLYFRVNVFPIHLPPLRERKDDIAELLKYFTQKKRGKKASISLHPEALRMLTQYPWPGNIRELENFVERLMLVKPNAEVILPEDINPLLEIEGDVRKTESSPVASSDVATWQEKKKAIGDVEKSLLENALREANGNISKASKLIRVSRDTFYRKMKKYSLDRMLTSFTDVETVSDELKNS